MSTQIEANVEYIKYQSNYYLNEKSKKCQEETTQNKAKNYSPVFKRQTKR